MLLGEPFTAAQAQAWGLVWQVVPPDTLEGAAGEVAARLAALAPPVAARFKRVLNAIGLDRFEAAVALENDAQRELMRGGD
jgi:2-(1,2-epoxy-1,2-dihydrophenyl)acetyl-CoA isomerase